MFGFLPFHKSYRVLFKILLIDTLYKMYQEMFVAFAQKYFSMPKSFKSVLPISCKVLFFLSIIPFCCGVLGHEKLYEIPCSTKKVLKDE